MNHINTNILIYLYINHRHGGTLAVERIRTKIVAAVAATAILLVEIPSLSYWEAFFLYQQYQEEDSKHLIAVANSHRVHSGGGSSASSSIMVLMMLNSGPPPSSSSGIPPKNKLVHSSFRIEEDVIRSLEVAAQKRGISMSSLVNKILKNYVTSEMYFEELGFILVSKKLLRKIFGELNTKQIEEIGKEYGLTIAREYMSYFYPRVNSATLICFLDLWFRRFQSYQHRVDNDNDNKRHYYTVNHDVNMNFSLALKFILEGLIEPIVKSAVDLTSITTTSITFSFEV
jgi:hypothetical protein